jgi:hypothetical protein
MMLDSHYLGQEPERLAAPEPLQPLEQPWLERDHAEHDLRATYPISTGDVRNPLGVETIAEHRIAPYLLEQTIAEDDRWNPSTN